MNDLLKRRIAATLGFGLIFMLGMITAGLILLPDAPAWFIVLLLVFMACNLIWLGWKVVNPQYTATLIKFDEPNIDGQIVARSALDKWLKETGGKVSSIGYRESDD